MRLIVIPFRYQPALYPLRGTCVRTRNELRVAKNVSSLYVSGVTSTGRMDFEKVGRSRRTLVLECRCVCDSVRTGRVVSKLLIIKAIRRSVLLRQCCTARRQQQQQKWKQRDDGRILYIFTSRLQLTPSVEAPIRLRTQVEVQAAPRPQLLVHFLFSFEVTEVSLNSCGVNLSHSPTLPHLPSPIPSLCSLSLLWKIIFQSCEILLDTRCSTQMSPPAKQHNSVISIFNIFCGVCSHIFICIYCVFQS